MFYPRLLFLLPHLVLLLATAVNSAPVPDTKGCTSCPNLPRGLQARGWLEKVNVQLGRWLSKGKEDVVEPEATNTKMYGILRHNKEQAETKLQTAQDRLQQVQQVTEGSSENQLSQIKYWQEQVEQLKKEVAEYQQGIREFLP
ncbi:hypothetical protein CF328_g8129 [Tilletia controversa]|nr:hypothetical protein CF328_g8129 [Tilletia controversa]